MFFVGIDPGAKGAISIIDSNANVHLLEDMPYNSKLKGLNCLGFVSMLKEFLSDRDYFICLERCQYTPAIKGSGAFTFGKTIGMTEACLLLGNFRHELVTPQKWKKHFSLIGKDKSASIALATKMFPSEVKKLVKTKDGRAESLLIAEYCRRNLGR